MPEATGTDEPMIRLSHAPQTAPERAPEYVRAIAPYVGGKPIEEVVDHYVEARLKQEGVTPAAQADDANLVRRLTLDLAGRIPTAAEARAYVESADPSKRTKLVDRLIASPGFVRHQANEFDVMLMGGTNRVTGALDLGEAQSFTAPRAGSDPAVCTPGQQYYNTSTGRVRVCTATNAWGDIAAGGGVSGSNLASGHVIVGAGGTSVTASSRALPAGALVGDTDPQMVDPTTGLLFKPLTHPGENTDWWPYGP